MEVDVERPNEEESSHPKEPNNKGKEKHGKIAEKIRTLRKRIGWIESRLRTQGGGKAIQKANHPTGKTPKTHRADHESSDSTKGKQRG